MSNRVSWCAPVGSAEHGPDGEAFDSQFAILALSMSTSAWQQRGGGSTLMRALSVWIADWGAVFIDMTVTLGELIVFSLQTFSCLFARVPRWSAVLPIFYKVGVLSLPVVALTGSFIGMVLAQQSYFQFHQIHMETQLGAVINITLLRELGPVLAATMLAGRVGSSMAAELGTMRVTEEIDALTVMGANPIQYLVVPRFLGCLLMIPMLTIMADFMGIVGGYIYSVFVLNIDMHYYWYNSERYVGNWDLVSGVIKSFFFGAAIALVSCHRGFHCGPGAEGVGRATIASFVYSFVMILLLDFLLNIALDNIYFRLWPDGFSRI